MSIVQYLRSKMISLIGMVYQEDIPEETRKSFEWFKIELSKKTIKKNEKYEERTITIYNLYRQECEIVNSLIIGIAHHIDFCIRGETDNSKSFFNIYQNLLYQAFQEKMLDYDELINSQDCKQIRLISKATNIIFENNKVESTCILEVLNSFQLKDYLRQHNFKYNTLHQSWEYEIDKRLLERSIRVIKAKDGNCIIQTRSPNKIIFGITAFCCVYGYTYNYKEILKSNRYYYQDGKWCKKIQACNYIDERNKLENLLPKGQGIKISIEYQ